LAAKVLDAEPQANDSSGMHGTGNADVVEGHDDELAPRKCFREFRKDGVQALNLELQGCPGQPEEQDAGVGQPLVESKLPKVPVATTRMRRSVLAIVRTSVSARA